MNSFISPRKKAKLFIKKRTDGEGIIKNGIVINMFLVLYFEHWFVFELTVPEMRQTMLNV